MSEKRALILVDIQNDFLPGGALAVPDGDAVIEVANRLIPQFEYVFATQDWHPANHGSFASQHADGELFDIVDLDGLPQTLWPDHCIQDSPGAEFAADLSLPEHVRVVQKGTQVNIDSYSGFFDNGKRFSTGLDQLLEAADVRRVLILGLATDYCVKFTALDAVGLGLKTELLEDGCRGVNLNAGDVDVAIREMVDAGIDVVQSSSL